VPEASKFDAPAWGGANRVEPVLTPADAPQKAAIPAGFDVAGFEKQAKLQFARMQTAYDAADRRALAELTTQEMFAEVTRELAARGDHKPTEIVTLTAELLEVTTEGNSHWASVRYAGSVREDGEPLAKPIDEVWNLAKPVDGSSGWVLAGIQQYA
jgi:predicted lipid-binding transport protein (Tim44 family)